MNFKDKAVAEKYEPTCKDDVTIRVGKYHGALSNISEAVAKKLIEVKDQNIKEKAGAATTTEPAE